jgi:hypothetical protein
METLSSPEPQPTIESQCGEIYDVDRLKSYDLRFEHLVGTGSVKKRPLGSPVDLAWLFLTSLIAARQKAMQQHAVSENSVSFIYERKTRK